VGLCGVVCGVARTAISRSPPAETASAVSAVLPTFHLVWTTPESASSSHTCPSAPAVYTVPVTAEYASAATSLPARPRHQLSGLAWQGQGERSVEQGTGCETSECQR
jgi:hypothetical protein